MFSLAATVGIPASFVALRHQISHEPLPSLPVLRNACRRALMWIREHYWDRLLLTSWSSRHPTGSRRNAENEAAAAAIRERIVRALEGGEGAHDWTALVLGEGSSRTELPVLLLALDEVENGLRDLKALSKLTRLRRALLMQAERNGDATGSENVDEMEVDREPLKDIDKAREKLESAKRQLDRMQQEDVEADVNLPAPTGWIKHEGPWRPRPIGELIV